MADLRIPPNLPAVSRAPTDARVQAARAAQRAFFQSATAQGGATAPAAAPAAPTRAAGSERLLRPGSIVDIKV